MNECFLQINAALVRGKYDLNDPKIMTHVHIALLVLMGIALICEMIWKTHLAESMNKCIVKCNQIKNK